MKTTTKKNAPYGSTKFKTIDEYHLSFPKNIRNILETLRKTIKQIAPKAQEVISYNMPTFKLNKNLVHYAAYKEHIGFYPTPSPIKKFKDELVKYKTSKGAIQFPIDKPLPSALIKKMVKYRVMEISPSPASVKDKGSKTHTTPPEAGSLSKDIQAYNNAQTAEDKEICNLLSREITSNLPGAENKIWHAHPVWFLDGNPIVGYSKLKGSVRLLFWSGQSFEEEGLQNEGSFKAAEVRYTSKEQVNTKDLKRWLKKSKEIQWDYKNIVKRKGVLERLR